MFGTTGAYGFVGVLGIALIAVGGLSGVARGQGTAGSGELLTLLARAFMAAEADRVNINTATAAELEKRLGIEEATARRIVARRPYASVADLARAGIASGPIQKMAPLVTAGPMPGSTRGTPGHRALAQAGSGEREAPTPGRAFGDVLFDFDTAEMRPGEAGKIEEIASLMKREAGLMVQLEGFADARGTELYNRGLSDRRAKAVGDALVARGVAARHVQIMAMGERSRSCPEPTEECYQKNRRVEVQVRPAG